MKHKKNKNKRKRMCLGYLESGTIKMQHAASLFTKSCHTKHVIGKIIQQQRNITSAT